MTMITPSYLGETIEYSSLHACRSTLEDPTCGFYFFSARVGSPILLFIDLTQQCVSRSRQIEGQARHETVGTMRDQK